LALLIQDKSIVLSSGAYYKVTQHNVRAGDMPKLVIEADWYYRLYMTGGLGGNECWSVV